MVGFGEIDGFSDNGVDGSTCNVYVCKVRCREKLVALVSFHECSLRLARLTSNA